MQDESVDGLIPSSGGIPPALRVGANRQIRGPWLVAQVVGIRRLPVQIKGTEKGIWCRMVGRWANAIGAANQEAEITRFFFILLPSLELSDTQVYEP